jgi:hypothetical protein
MQGQAAAAVVTALREARAPGDEQPRRKRCDFSEEEFERRHAQVQDEKFWAWQQGTDNATHFKSKENLNFWSERPHNHSAWLKMVWVEFGCPGHGKGPWDGLGAMVKTKVTLDIMHGKERTMTGKITSPILVAQHLRATFCKKEWLMEHVNTPINEIVVMYQSAEQIIRPPAPPDVSVCKGIMSCFSFLFLGVPRHYAKRPFSCWCQAC